MVENYWLSARHRRQVGRRTVLGGGAALGAAFLAACGGGGGEKKESKEATAAAPAGGQAGVAPGAPRRGGILKTFFSTETKNLDPHAAADRTQTLVNRIPYNGLIQQMEPTPGDFQLKEDLAESWEVTDAANYSFKLRKGVKFHNKPPVSGREFTAKDVRANLERLGSDRAYRATAANFKLIEAIETPDDYTVRLRLKQPFATFPMQLGTVYGMMVAPEIFEGDLVRRQMLGTGPFMLESWDGPVGFKFVRNPEYFVKDRPYLDGVEHGVISDPARALSAFRSGSIDHLFGFGLADLTAVKGVPKATVHTVPGTGGRTYLFNHEKRPYIDLRVRQAIMYAINPDEFNRVIWEGLSKRDGILSAGFKKYAWPEAKLWKPDTKKAKDLLSAAGYPNGFDEELIAAPERFIADFDTIAQRQLRQIGINVKLLPGDYNGWVDRIINCDRFAMELWGYNDYETPDRYLYPYLHAVAGFKCWYHSPTLNANLDKGRATTREEDAIKVYNDVQQEAYDNVAYVPLVSAVQTFALQGYVKNLEPGIGEAYFYRHLENAWIDKG